MPIVSLRFFYSVILVLVLSGTSSILSAEESGRPKSKKNKQTRNRACDVFFAGNISGLFKGLFGSQKNENEIDLANLGSAEESFYKQALTKAQADAIYGTPEKSSSENVEKTSDSLEEYYKIRDIEADTREQMARTGTTKPHLVGHKQRKILKFRSHIRRGEWKIELNFLRDYFATFLYAAEVVMSTNAYLKEVEGHVQQYPEIAKSFFRSLEIFTRPARSDANVSLIQELRSIVLLGKDSDGVQATSTSEIHTVVQPVKSEPGDRQLVAEAAPTTVTKKEQEARREVTAGAVLGKNGEFATMSSQEYWEQFNANMGEYGPRDAALNVIHGLASAVLELNSDLLLKSSKRKDALFDSLKVVAAKAYREPRNEKHVLEFLDQCEQLFSSLRQEAHDYDQGDGLSPKLRRATEENTYEREAAAHAVATSFFINSVSGEVFTFVTRGFSSTFEVTEQAFGKWGGQLPGALKLLAEKWRRLTAGITNDIAAGFYWVDFHDFVKDNLYKHDSIVYEVLQEKNFIGRSAFQQYITSIGRVSEGEQLLKRLVKYIDKAPDKGGPDIVNEIYQKQIRLGLEDSHVFGSFKRKPTKTDIGFNVVKVHAVIGAQFIGAFFITGLVTVGANGVQEFLETSNKVVIIPLTESVGDLAEWVQNSVWEDGAASSEDDFKNKLEGDPMSGLKSKAWANEQK